MYYLAEEEQKAAMEVIKSGALFRYWSPDSKVAAFEAAVAEKFGVKYALAVNGGTSSLITALFAAGVGPGDEGKVEYSRDMCPKTLDYLGHAINIGISPFWENANIDKIANAIKAAAKETL